LLTCEKSKFKATNVSIEAKKTLNSISRQKFGLLVSGTNKSIFLNYLSRILLLCLLQKSTHIIIVLTAFSSIASREYVFEHSKIYIRLKYLQILGSTILNQQFAFIPMCNNIQFNLYVECTLTKKKFAILLHSIRFLDRQTERFEMLLLMPLL
jgi:hypothetical protein